jgi:hypothetical protein
VTRLAVIVAIVALYSAFTTASSAATRVLTITIENLTPSFDVVPTIEGAVGDPPIQFVKSAQPNSFEHKLTVSENDWFNEVNIRLLWKNAYDKNLLGQPKTDFDQRIRLRIRRDFPESFYVPVYFSNDRSKPEMLRLENMQDATQQFEVVFRGHQIASYYRDTFAPQNPFAQRAANLFFFAAVKLAETKDYVVVMSDAAEKFAKDSFGNQSAINYSDTANRARSWYWADLKRIDGYAARGDCSTARLILTTLQILKAEDPKAFDAQYSKSPTMLEEKGKIIDGRCGAGVAAQPDKVVVEFRGELDLKPFACGDITEKSFVKRVCYDESNQYMLINLNGRYFHYCEIDQGTVAGLTGAQSPSQFYAAKVKGNFDCRTHRVPTYDARDSKGSSPDQK